MTRLKDHPLRRIVQHRGGEFVATMQGDLLRLRPLRARQGGPAEIAISWAGIYRIAFQPPKKKRGRGLLR